MNIEYRFSQVEYEQYLHSLKQYFNELEIECEQNSDHIYFQITRQYATELQAYLGDKLFSKSSNQKSILSSSDRRATKYLDFVEAYRLVRYQYSRYGQFKRSYTEAVYSSFIAEVLRYMHEHVHSPLHIMDAGCGPSRLSYEFSTIFHNAQIDLIDYSIINLFFAWRLISSGKDVSVPYRIFNDNWKEDGDDTGLLHIKAKNNTNTNLIIADLSSLQWKQPIALYDLVVSNHALNLLHNPKQVIESLIDQVKTGGFIIISDLLGWKENRPKARREFPDGKAFYHFFNNNSRIKVIEYFSGGPYCEEVNSERIDTYVNHFIVLQKL
ncbi:methyltransferase domain-containing protein [Paenibacillus wynnii]|uniref:Methyltransferase domain-containing protein n=1 Tax=Paenibacillus wynnii TaxID=268407 RepID=A0A098M3E4_9BACL|nr:methyltransferase domain-containing protein [Paenibacillus wynnii]KGE16521.1 hypothetical protein PWYN_17480 [Paenibacillus wynnii]